MSRVYAIEATPTLLGAAADHRFIAQPADTLAILRSLAAAIGAGPAAWRDLDRPLWADAVARDLAAHRGAALLHAGPEQSPESHALVHALNINLRAPVTYIEPVVVDETPEEGIGSLCQAMQAGEVDTLVMLETNPIYDAPADLGFSDALGRVPLSIHLATHVDETARQATFHAPALHIFESWGDARAFDGTASLLQPQVQPLVDGRSAGDLLALLIGDDRDARARAIAFWRSQADSDFDRRWDEWLRRGVVSGSAAAPVTPALRTDFAETQAATSIADERTGDRSLTLLFRPDPFLRGGALANSGWLQELPRPLTRLTWDNAALIAPATAKRLQLQSGDIVEIGASGSKIAIPVVVLPGQAEDCVTLPLGYGHVAGGRMAGSIGSNAYPLRRTAALWQAGTAELAATGAQHRLATTQHHDTMDGRDIVRTEALAAFLARPARADNTPPQPTIYPPPPEQHGPRWAMAISLNACIGCGACVAACQAENNIPVVGRDQVLEQREMQWLRIDRYWGGAPDNPRILFQPVPCMHCENAPCEVVCPVGATMHDSSGLNVMVYNRCVGTRFCSNNCPYKVRRFNFLGYAALDDRPAIAWNPDVTVRARGVMEKCTYCLQRICAATIAADRDNRPLRDGEIKTACQQACPADAIVFGDLSDEKSAVRARKASPLDYALLEETNTRPRTTYAARLWNRNPEIDAG